MPPAKKLQKESEEDRIKRIAEEETDAAIRRAMESPAQRSAVEKASNPTLAERLIPGSATGQQALRQVVDTGTSAIGGGLVGGPQGALYGGLASALAGVINPEQAQEIGSTTNAMNMAAPALGGLAKLFPGGRKLIEKFPAAMGAVFGGFEAGGNAGARAADTHNDIPTATGIGGILGALTGGAASGIQAKGRELPASISPEVRQGLRSLSESSAGKIPSGSNPQQLLETLTGHMRQISPYMRTAGEELEQKIQSESVLSQLAAAGKEVPKAQKAAKAAATKLNTVEKQKAIDEALIEQGTGVERARMQDFIRSYPDQKKELDAQLEALAPPHRRDTPQTQKQYDELLDKRNRLRSEFESSITGAGNEAALGQKVKLAEQKALGDYEKKVRDASMVSGTADAKYKEARNAVNNLVTMSKSLVTKEEVRQQALDALVNSGIRDPRHFSDEARQAIRVLTSDSKFSPQSLFEKTLESKSGSEMMTSGLMEAIGNDDPVKASLRSRYLQHVFDKFQQGATDNVYGRTFKPEEFSKYVSNLNRRAFNNFMENPDAYDTLTALSDRLLKSQKGINNHMLGISVGVGAGGMAAYAGSHTMGGGNQNTDTGGLLLNLLAGAAAGGTVGRLLSWKHLANGMLQEKGLKAKEIQRFLQSDNPGVLPKATVKTAISAILGGSAPTGEPQVKE